MAEVTNHQPDRHSRSGLVRVWDPFVRIFHWSLIALFLFAYFTGNEWDQPHEWAGYFIGGLLVGRVLWGFIGSTHARFSDFIYRPTIVTTFLRDSLRLRGQFHIAGVVFASTEHSENLVKSMVTGLKRKD